jgi:hypothetical protein
MTEGSHLRNIFEFRNLGQLEVRYEMALGYESEEAA